MIPDRLRRSEPQQWWLALGVLCAVVMAVTLASLVALSSRPFSSIDENAHTSYALDVAHGRLPTMHTDVTPRLDGMFREPTYVANHPPLYYVFAGTLLRAGIAAGHPLGGFFAARLLSAGFLAVALVAMAWSVRLLFPGRRRLAVIVPGVVGVIPLVTSASAIVWNDSAALAATSLALAFSLNVVCRGLTRGRFVLLAAASSAAALTRSSGLTIVAVAAIACAFSAWKTSQVNRGRWLRAVLVTAGLLAVVFTASGWFYLRNESLYGDPTGSKVALAMFPAPHIPILGSLFSATFWTGEFNQLFGRLQYFHGSTATVAQVIRWGIGLGLVVGALSWIRARRSPDAGRPPMGVAGRFGIFLVAVQALLTVGVFLQYAHQGGAIFARYLLPAAFAAGLVAAVAMDHLPGARRGLPAALLIGAGAWIGFQELSLGLRWHNPTLAHEGTVGRLITALGVNGLPAPRLLVGLALSVLAVSFALLVSCLWKLDEKPERRQFAPANTSIELPNHEAPSRPVAPRSHRESVSVWHSAVRIHPEAR